MIDPQFAANLFAWIAQVTLLTATATVLLVALDVRAPALRYAVWRTLLALCVLLPLVQPWQPALGTPPSAELTIVPGAPFPGGGTTAGTALPVTAAPAPALQGWLDVLGLVLVAGAALRLAWLGAGLLRLRRFRRAGARAAAADEHAELTRLIETGAEIRYVPRLGQPVTFGLVRPVVLLPESLRRQPPPVQRAILTHELWHVRRRDWMWILLEEAVRAILWFNPPIWFVISRLQAAREEVVDELTVLLTNSRRGYLEALLAFADEPPLFAAAPFARRRHLFRRMLLISREDVMSSTRIATAGAILLLAVVATTWAGAATFPLTAAPQLQTPPRDAKPGAPRPATSREAELQKAIAAAPTASASLYNDLAKLQEDRNAIEEAEATLQAGRRAFPQHEGIRKQLASFYMRHGHFDRLITMVEEAAAADPSNPMGHHLVATYYHEKIVKDPKLTTAEKMTYLQAAVAAEDRALSYDSDFVEALTGKDRLLRYQAGLERDPGQQTALIAEADALRQRAQELNKQRADAKARERATDVDGQAPVRIGGQIKPPTKIKDVRPVYPLDARESGVQGVIILEVVVDAEGRVRDTKVLRSIPLLDQAAVDAVRQWEFTPTLMNGGPVPVIMTVTVNFTLQ